MAAASLDGGCEVILSASCLPLISEVRLIDRPHSVPVVITGLAAKCRHLSPAQSFHTSNAGTSQPKSQMVTRGPKAEADSQ